MNNKSSSRESTPTDLRIPAAKEPPGAPQVVRPFIFPLPFPEPGLHEHVAQGKSLDTFQPAPEAIRLEARAKQLEIFIPHYNEHVDHLVSTNASLSNLTLKQRQDGLVRLQEELRAIQARQRELTQPQVFPWSESEATPFYIAIDFGFPS
jgi:hypothetical protein